MATLTLRDLTVSTVTALGTVPNGIANVASGLETYATEWRKERELQMLKNAVRRTAEITTLRSKMEESGITSEVISQNQQWVKEMLK